MHIDHIVIWVEDVARSLDFYANTLGLETVREQEYRDGTVKFPSVRINSSSIIDLMSRADLLPMVQSFTGGGPVAGGAPINHVCLALTRAGYDAAIQRLETRGVTLNPGGEDVFGAQGQAVRSTYFSDPDGNVLEIRFYAD